MYAHYKNTRSTTQEQVTFLSTKLGEHQQKYVVFSNNYVPTMRNNLRTKTLNILYINTPQK